MKKYLIASSILLLFVSGYSQTSVKTAPVGNTNLDQYMWSFSKSRTTAAKPLIDFDAMDNWRGLGSYLSVSYDGNYFAYTINKMVYNDFKFGLLKIDSIVIESVKNGQRAVFAGLQPGEFTADSKRYIFQDKGALCFLQLGTAQVQKIEDVTSYRISQGKWLVYQLKGKDGLILRNLATGKESQFTETTEYNFSSNGDWLTRKNKDKELSLYNLATGAERKFPGVEEYLFAQNEKGFLVKATDKNNAVLQYVNLVTGEVKIIWNKEKTTISNYCIDAAGKQAAFAIVDNSDAANTGAWYYSAGMDRPILKISNQTAGIPAGLIIEGMSFTDNGDYLNLSLLAMPVVAGKPKDDLAGLEVWNHKDLNLQSVQLKQVKRPKVYNALISIETGRPAFLESDDKKLVQVKGDFGLIKKDNSDNVGDRFWEQGKGSNQDSNWIISLKDGSTHFLPIKSQAFWFSPSGKYLVYFDASKAHFYSYDLYTGAVNKISATVAENQLGIIDKNNGQIKRSAILAAWLEKDAGVLVYDSYDIWKLPLDGNSPAVNLTNGLGKSGGMIFNLFETDRTSFDVPVLTQNATLLLRAFNDNNKETGFYVKSVTGTGSPKLLSMGNYFMSKIGGIHDPNFSNDGLPPAKATNANSWIVQRQSTNDAPNYYQTSDFKNFKRLTNFQPQKKYQWLTQQLVTFNYLDGKTGSGILYKPENFDPNKKYPVLIAFYGRFSNNMYQYPAPSYIDQAMETGKSPLWLLNNGYLVFSPDIAVMPSKFGPKAFSVIEGAAQYLKTLPYVDGNKLGIASHSWGAKLAAYIFNHSTSIAATAITEGLWYGNIINVALSTEENGNSKLDGAENGEYQFGNLWENKKSWLDHTTVLNVDKAASPLLLLCNKESAPEYQNQTLQFFISLRRLDKNVWWLKYDKGSHTLSDQKELKDYTIRYTQFFDHYLKNAPAPQWMTEGVPYKLKGIESRYELDVQGTCNAPNGEHCFICEAWNKQYKKTPQMFAKEIKDWELDMDIAAELERKQKERRKQLDKEGEIRTKEVMRMLNKK